MAERNPNHEPAGSSKGGQFTSGNAAVNKMIRKGAKIPTKVSVARISKLLEKNDIRLATTSAPMYNHRGQMVNGGSVSGEGLMVRKATLETRLEYHLGSGMDSTKKANDVLAKAIEILRAAGYIIKPLKDISDYTYEISLSQ